MKSKGIMALALIGVLGFGANKAFAQVSNNTIPKNTVITEKAVAQDSNKANKLKEVALNAFEKNFNETVDVNNLYERNNEFYEVNGHKFYMTQWCNKNSEFINGNTAIIYTAVIDAETNKIVNLEYQPGAPKDQNYKNFSYDEAKNLATNFVKANNILNDKSYEFLEKESKEVSLAKGSEGAYEYCFYFKYDEGKTCLVNVNKDLKKVTQFILIDEVGSQG